jgi:hypothetical protein
MESTPRFTQDLLDIPNQLSESRQGQLQMPQETARIYSASNATGIGNVRQNTTLKSESTPSSINVRLPEIHSKDLGVESRAPSEKSKDTEGSSSETSRSEIGMVGQVAGDQEGVPTQSSREPTTPSGLATISKARSPLSHHDRATPKLVSHRVNLDKKIRKQIWNIRKAIKEEGSRSSSTANSGILKGLKKALSRLTAIGSHSSLSLAPQSPSSQKRISSSENDSSDEKPLYQEPIQTATPPTTQQSPTALEGSQSPSITIVVEERIPTPLGTTSQDSPTDAQLALEERIATPLSTTSHHSLTDAQPADASVLTLENVATMVEGLLPNGEKNQEEQDSAFVDHDMTDTEATEAHYFPLTEQCHHYTRRSDVDWDIQK